MKACAVVLLGVLVVLLGCLGGASDVEELRLGDVRTFEEFKAFYGKRYATAEEERRRRAIFEAAVRDVEKLRSSGEPGCEVHGITKFSDLEPAEFRARLRTFEERTAPCVGCRDSASQVSPARHFVRSAKGRLYAAVAPQYDWTESGASGKPYNVSVLDQGDCGSCWAFATVQAVEAQRMIYFNKDLQRLSVQQVTECAPGSGACEGGTLSDALEYIRDSGVMETVKYCRDYCELASGADQCWACYADGGAGYPTQSQCSGAVTPPDCCNAVCNRTEVDWAQKGYNNRSMTYIRSFNRFDGTDDELVAILRDYGPLPIVIDADWMQSYVSGVAQPTCSTPNHAVLLVGYGSADGVRFWRLKNSWGAGWGEDGFFRVRRAYCALTTGVAYISRDPEEKGTWEEFLDFLRNLVDFNSWEFYVACGVVGVVVVSILACCCGCVFCFWLANAIFCGGGATGVGGAGAGGSCGCGFLGGCCNFLRGGGRTKEIHHYRRDEMELKVSPDLYSRDGKIIL